MNSDSEQTSPDDGSSANKLFRKLLASKLPSQASGRQWRDCDWEDRLSELADYRKIHGHCNIPRNYSGDNTKLAFWVGTQRTQYKLHLQGKRSQMTLSRVQELEGLGFEWVCVTDTWEDRLSELAAYRRIHGHCNVPQRCSENIKLGTWVRTQRNQYRLHLQGNKSFMTLSHIQKLESLGFEWRPRKGTPKKPSLNDDATRVRDRTVEVPEYTQQPPSNASLQQCSAWKDRLSALADYRKIHGHCNVPQRCSETSKLATWVTKQRSQYRLHREGKTSYMTLVRIRALESLAFDWGIRTAAWEDRLSELADYRKIHGHCNVPTNYSESTKLGAWVGTQRTQYRLHLQGMRSQMTLSRVQELESLGFECKPRKRTPKKPSLNDDATRGRDRAVEVPEHMQQRNLKKIPVLEKTAGNKSTSPNPKNPTGMANFTSTSSRVEAQTNRGEAEDARFDETDLGGSYSELTAKPSLYSDTQAAKSLSLLDKSAPADDSAESNYREDALQAKVPWQSYHLKIMNSFSCTLLVASPPENGLLVAAKKPANSRQGTESQLETAPSNEMFRVNPVEAEPLQQKLNVFIHALLVEDEPAGNGAPATQDKPVYAPQDMQQTPPDEAFQSDNVLNKVELELVWLGEESMYCLSCPEFQFDFIYEYASLALKVELRKLSRDSQSEAEKLKLLVRMEEWLVSRRFDFVRKDIRMMLCRGFRRQRMGIVTAELRLLRRRQQSKRPFPAMIIDRS